MVASVITKNGSGGKQMEIMRKGILLAGGANSRLYPTTRATAKSLLPIYDKPLIYYSLSTLMLTGIRDILIITSPDHLEAHKRLLLDGSQWGLRLSYIVQDKPRGIADAFILGRDFVDNSPSALILGDNLYYSSGLSLMLQTAAAQEEGATVFAYQVPDPSAFGVVEFDNNGKVVSLEEKPAKPKSPYAVTGCYFYDTDVCDIVDNLKPSGRGELEITDVNREYMHRDKLHVQYMGRGAAWFDTGTPNSLAEAANFVHVIQKQQGQMIACPEEISWRNGWIDDDSLLNCADMVDKTPYGDYLRSLVNEKSFSP